VKESLESANMAAMRKYFFLRLCGFYPGSLLFKGKVANPSCNDWVQAAEGPNIHFSV